MRRLDNPLQLRLQSGSNPIKPWLLASLLPAWLVLLSGCTWSFPWNQAKPSVQEPPFIPAPAKSEQTVDNSIPILYSGAFSDATELADSRKHHPLLAQAISHGIAMGILRPKPSGEAFLADEPVSYGVFKQWANDYQAAEAGRLLENTPTDPTAPEPKKPISPEKAVPELKPAPLKAGEVALQDPFNPAKLNLLTDELPWQTTLMDANQTVSREMLCALYVLLSKKLEEAQALSLEAIEGIAAGSPEDSMGEALADFKDYNAISLWAKPFVAVAYRDGLMQKSFNLTTNQLTVDTGFNPQKPATREQAILTLFQVYGHIQTPLKQLPAEMPMAQASKPTNNSSSLNRTQPTSLTVNEAASKPIRSIPTN